MNVLTHYLPILKKECFGFFYILCVFIIGVIYNANINSPLSRLNI